MSTSARLLRVPSPLPVLATGVFVLVIGAVLAASGDTFGFDFLAYHNAATRVLRGEQLYEAGVDFAGAFGLFLYPPPFVLAVLPFGMLEARFATAVWTVLLFVAFFAAVAILPVRSEVRWLVLLLAGLSWPVAYTFKLGQVTPILMLLFAVGWRWRERPDRLGTSAAVGALIKVQPGLVLLWAAGTRRWPAAVAGALVIVAASVAATIVVGVGAWFDYATLLSRVANPITTPHNFTPGAVLFQLGVPERLAAAAQVIVVVLVVISTGLAARLAAPAASYLSAVTASQLLSPVLWDHYVMLTLLPVAWLLEKRRWWAAAIPLATSTFALSITPPAAYPAVLMIVLLALLVLGRRQQAEGEA